MRIGVDGLKIPESATRGPLNSLVHGQRVGYGWIVLQNYTANESNTRLRRIAGHQEQGG